ncbi:UDP-glycosyltransferase 79A6 [Glycine max]|nr:UDP-glycosyltransferase 79A6 [Glycine max]
MSFRPFIMLKHSSVGYHLGHGGFNSVIEALPSDYELVLLPFMEAGIEVNKSEDGDFKKEDILKAVKTIMVEDDKEPRKHIKENHMKWKDTPSSPAKYASKNAALDGQSAKGSSDTMDWPNPNSPLSRKVLKYQLDVGSIYGTKNSDIYPQYNTRRYLCC